MKRLTLKLDDPIDTKYLHYEYKRIPDYDINHGNTGRITVADIYNKLGQLEDIEEELGIDLITLFKALKYGAYIKGEIDYMYGFKSSQKINRVYVDNMNRYHIECYTDSFTHISCLLPFKDYGKTWALTREELE